MINSQSVQTNISSTVWQLPHKKFIVFEIAPSYHSRNGTVIESKSFRKGMVSGAAGIPLKLTELSTDTVDQYLKKYYYKW